MMRLKQGLVLLLIFLGVPSGLGKSAQDPQLGQPYPSFTGSWVLEKYLVGSKTPPVKINITMLISHTAPEIRINRKLVIDGKEYNQELTYYSDGRGERNQPFVEDRSIIKSKTKWNKNKLMTRASVPDKNIGDINQYMEEEWELSSDGKFLTHVTKWSLAISPRPTSITERVYKRVS